MCVCVCTRLQMLQSEIELSQRRSYNPADTQPRVSPSSPPLQEQKFKGDVMDLRLDIERRKRFAGKERDYKREGGRSPGGGSRGPSAERSSEKSGKHHKKSK